MKIEQIEELCNKATRGPWRIDYLGCEEHRVGHITTGKDPETNCRYVIIADHREDYSDPSHDTKFIAYSRELMPKLISVAKAAKNEALFWNESYCNSHELDQMETATRTLINSIKELEQE